MLAVGAGEHALFAVEDDLVGAVPVLDHLQPSVDLPAQLLGGEVVAGDVRPRQTSSSDAQSVIAASPYDSAYRTRLDRGVAGPRMRAHQQRCAIRVGEV